ncbi:MAG TPA: fatty acid desaturase [Stellaceae bacterium]|nr:fatty acid desaturase [Stellaceae bacterium]
MRESEARKAIEWPTVALAAAIYAAWAALTLLHQRLPASIVAALGAWLVAWHSSLQHEIIHGHPTRWRRVNDALGRPPLALWLSFDHYRATHLQHHRDDDLTDPLADPESRYLTAAAWARLRPWARALIGAQTTLLGRLLLGPACCVFQMVRAEARAILAGDGARARLWARHTAAVALVLLWVVGVCGIDPWFYLFAIVYPATSLMLLRSFAEHRAAAAVRQRTAIVENAAILGLLFLFNNLHAAHHERPALPWYALPRWYRRNRARLLRENGGLVYDGYRDIARRFLLKPHDAPVHPIAAAAA